ncbi:MAG: phosphotransferase [Chlamydiales bacterium]|nr:aminoglycoside phosphotransferase family protein [Chlamydiales bacterium]NCF71186.1 phosphotransferase [Chlamydiales bacterium]
MVKREDIDVKLARELVSRQFPEWSSLSITDLSCGGGWDNCCFHLGKDKLLRFPSAKEYAHQVEKEHQYLDFLASRLPLKVPHPVAIGEAEEGLYPWKWSVYLWIKGKKLARSTARNIGGVAEDLAMFLSDLYSIDSHTGPKAGKENFYRGSSPLIYDKEFKEGLSKLSNKFDKLKLLKIWEASCDSLWEGNGVWIHGDISPDNLLVNDGKLCAVIDFGLMAIGDPACDLAIAWNFFEEKERLIFKACLDIDKYCWERAKAWALWKATITLAGMCSVNNTDSKRAESIIWEIISK